MFYLPIVFSKKGPWSTVWSAVHLQHKLNKSHYTSTNVPSTVERILDPGVPIALRLRGLLLLGVVRIYSKQVDYVYEESNEIRNKINRDLTSMSINLPDDATHAPFHSVTLPEKLNLDSLEFDDYCNDWSVDSHLKSQDDITLEEQIPTGQDIYIGVSLNEDNSGSAPVPMEEDVHPSNQLGADDINVGNRSPQEPSSIEIMRDASHENLNSSSPVLPDRAEPDKFLEEQIAKDKQTSTPVTDGVVSPDARFSSPQNHEEQHSFGGLDSSMPFVHRSPEMELKPTPPPAAQPRVTRKRKWLFDKSIVLSNKHMKNARDDTSDIRRVFKNCPLSSLTIWKSNMRSRMRKGGVFYDPFITGSCADLQRMYDDDFVSAKPHFSRRDTDDTRVEFHRNNDFASPDRNMSFTNMPSPNERSYLSPLNTNTADMGTSGNLYSDIPEFVASPGELGFLAPDDNSPAGSHATPVFGIFPNNQETPELQRLSPRTRAVAQYLKRQSSATPILGSSEESSSYLSLNKILEGKPKKICARMFFETLVLKSYGLVDVHQDQKKPYDHIRDITLKVS